MRSTMGESDFANAVSRVRLREPIVRPIASRPMNDQHSPWNYAQRTAPIEVMSHATVLPVPAEPSKYLDEKQLCAELSISSVTATKWRRNAEGPAFVRVGRLIRYPRASVDAWLASRTVGVPRPP
ncbi:MAG: helix-turn-helix domain-containing protein [Deltaproteobacteria bacterium]|nr:helix-turn-helix domain-containing protein [Deltaproteobacteria bacterium]